MGTRFCRLFRKGVVAGIALSATVVSAPVASAADSGVLYACVHQNPRDREVHGAIYLVTAHEPCRAGFARVTLSAGGSGEDVTALEQRVTALEAQIQTLQGLLTLASHLKVQTGTINDLPGPHVIVEGANLHVRSGAGRTAGTPNGTLTGGTPNGLGNLVVGYNERLVGADASYRAGSHNLVVGPEHTYSSTGGLVAGYGNGVTGESASVAGGAGNYATGLNASVSGGLINTANGPYSNILGGEFNSADGYGATVAGGNSNVASGGDATVSGGMFRSAPRDFNWAAGTLLQNQ